MPGHATLFDVSPAPVSCGERPRTTRVWHFRLRTEALVAPAQRVAQAIRETDLVRVAGSADAVLISVEATGHSLPADLVLVRTADVANALKASIPVDVEVPATISTDTISVFWTESRWANVGLVIPLDAPSSWVAEDTHRWATLRDCLRVPQRSGRPATASRAMIARLRVGMAPDRALLAAVDELAREDGITTIAIAADQDARAGHVERVTHAIDTLWATGVSVLEIPCDAVGAVFAPQDVDRSIVDTLRKAFPLDVASADTSMLARVPGIGRSAIRLVAARAAGELNQASDFTSVGVDLARARPFLRHHAL